MKYAKIINQFEIEISPKNLNGIFNFDNHIEAMASAGYLPLVESEPQEGKKPCYKQEQGRVIESWVELSEPELNAYKDAKINELWRNYKQYQTKFVDAEDLILATTLSLAGKPKGTAVRNWVQALWGAYYVEKDKLTSASNANDLTEVVYIPALGEPPFTIRELNVEATEVQP